MGRLETHFGYSAVLYLTIYMGDPETLSREVGKGSGEKERKRSMKIKIKMKNGGKRREREENGRKEKKKKKFPLMELCTIKSSLNTSIV